MKKNLIKTVSNMAKMAKNKKVNKGAAPPGGQILQILMAQNLYFTKLYNIPEMINHVDPAKNPQSTLVIFGNLPPKRPIFGFWAIILEPHQINPKFLHFLNALRCPDLGQAKNFFVG